MSKQVSCVCFQSIKDWKEHKNTRRLHIFLLSPSLSFVYFNIMLAACVCVNGSFDRVHLHDQCLLFPIALLLFAFWLLSSPLSVFLFSIEKRILLAPLLLVIYLLFVLPFLSLRLVLCVRRKWNHLEEFFILSSLVNHSKVDENDKDERCCNARILIFINLWKLLDLREVYWSRRKNSGVLIRFKMQTCHYHVLARLCFDSNFNF